MQLAFVGHAGAMIESRGVSLLMDPWLKGEAFNESWSLYPQAVLPEDWLSRVTHIWISHEHPDHFSIPTLKSIPQEIRARITVLFQKHFDTTVLDWLLKQGFAQVREMPHSEWLNLNPDFQVACFQVGHTDSALAIKAEGKTILNLNDCDLPVRSMHRLKRHLGNIDLLMDQFSIAGWPGNPGDIERRSARAQGAIDALVRDFSLFQPRYVMPFASFVRFSHTENAYMNSMTNTVEDVAQRVEPERLVVMYPGDTWRLGSPHKSMTDTAIFRYAQDRRALDAQSLRAHDLVPLDQILSAANDRIADYRVCYHSAILRRLEPVTFHITDIGKAIEVNLAVGAREVDLEPDRCVVALSSQAAYFTFQMRFGLPTLGVSGRYAINHSEKAFLRLKKLGSAYSSGFYSKKLPNFGLNARLMEFVWRRRADLVGQFARRLV